MSTAVAYHEAGHAVVAAWLGAEVVSVTLEPDWDDGPRRDGDAAIRWHHRGLTPRELCRRELMAVLAGPVAEMLHCGERCPLDSLPQWAGDWQLACQFASVLVRDQSQVETLIEITTDKLYRLVGSDAFWQVIAEVADLLDAYETIEGDQVHAALSRWLGG